MGEREKVVLEAEDKAPPNSATKVSLGMTEVIHHDMTAHSNNTQSSYVVSARSLPVKDF